MIRYEYFRRPEQRDKKGRKKYVPPWKREREINPDTGRPFMDPKSRLRHGRVICKGKDMEDLRRRVGERESEICQKCEEWAEIAPPENRHPGEMHHIYGRGMGGGKRNDIAAEMQWLCHGCHPKTKIKKRSQAETEKQLEKSA